MMRRRVPLDAYADRRGTETLAKQKGSDFRPLSREGPDAYNLKTGDLRNVREG